MTSIVDLRSFEICWIQYLGGLKPGFGSSSGSACLRKKAGEPESAYLEKWYEKTPELPPPTFDLVKLIISRGPKSVMDRVCCSLHHGNRLATATFMFPRLYPSGVRLYETLGPVARLGARRLALVCPVCCA